MLVYSKDGCTVYTVRFRCDKMKVLDEIQRAAK